MKYLKYFENLNENLKPDEFDTECLEEIKSIFNEFAEENNFYKFEWELNSSPEEIGIHYSYLTWIELENQPNENKSKLSTKILNNMITTKYFNILVNINEEMEYKKKYGGAKCTSQWHDIIQKINDNFIKRIETIGYKVKISNGSSTNIDLWSDTIILKIDYSEV
jgi:hypothetical protein